MEQKSLATPAESLALRDDARSISQEAASTTLPLKTAENQANVVTILLNRAPLDGWMDNDQWSLVQSRLVNSLQGLGVSPAVLDKTISDMEVVASSARVTASEYQNFTADFNQLRADENSNGGNIYGYPDPELYLGQHLLGFFRGSAVSQSSNVATLNSDLKSIPAASSASPAGIATVRRDAGLLQKLGAAVPSATEAQLTDTYVAAFAQGVPSSQTLAQLKTALIAELGASATHARTAWVNRLITDAPALAQALGSSAANVQTIASDVQNVVNDGLGAAPDPFKVTVTPNAG